MTPSELSRRRLKLYVSDPPEIQDGDLPKVPKDSDAVEPPPASPAVENASDSTDSSDSEKTLELGAWYKKPSS